MSDPDAPAPEPPRSQPDPELIERVERVNTDLMKFVRQVRTASPPVRTRLQLDLRERLERQRRDLLGRHSVLPVELRHYAVTFTEVQWMLDVWIDACAREVDEPLLRREFMDVASRLLGELEVLRAPDPALDPPARRPLWWSALTRGLHTEGDEPPRSGEPDILL
ncbi:MULTISPECIES: hypothetical protein [Caldimonas]|jgi:hypothetical protein|uniref:hypothetical protein n=1 Tax=Caldimonas TaxID=196013 RepID=UPI00036FD043|nr:MULTISPECIES: hypothetical protein [Caldimonas]GIX24587.1 MAG: hypothetical protein KatS3mg122_1818 [Caldimonas sp.]